MKKFILAAAAVIAPIAALASPASAAAPAAKATGSVTWDYLGTATGSVVFNANDKTGGTLDYADSRGETLHGVVTPGTVVKDGGKVVFEGTITDSTGPNAAWNIGKPFTGVVIDVGTPGRNGDQIALFVDRPADGTLADVTGGNLTVH
jgi:hypothetical protein